MTLCPSPLSSKATGAMRAATESLSCAWVAGERCGSNCAICSALGSPASLCAMQCSRISIASTSDLVSQSSFGRVSSKYVEDSTPTCGLPTCERAILPIESLRGSLMPDLRITCLTKDMDSMSHTSSRCLTSAGSSMSLTRSGSRVNGPVLRRLRISAGVNLPSVCGIGIFMKFTSTFETSSTKSPDASTRSAPRCFLRDSPFFAYFWSKTKCCTADVARKLGGGRTSMTILRNVIAVGLDTSARNLFCRLHCTSGVRFDSAWSERTSTENECRCWLACRRACTAIDNERSPSSFIRASSLSLCLSGLSAYVDLPAKDFNMNAPVIKP
mmetsp:Transcript_64071/g.143192  ORF Transcript_64071/g.143192 Transcript_64071/m.143192 type:complete len:328 (+) Transcript_64071:1099-2082(+)